MKSTTIAFVICVSGAASAQVTSPVCVQMQTAVEDSEKELSALAVTAVGETSAIREGAREQRTANQLQLIALNLSIASQQHCPPPKEPIRKTAYWKSALACNSVESGVYTTDTFLWSTNIPAPCIRSNWTREPPGTPISLKVEKPTP